MGKISDKDKYPDITALKASDYFTISDGSTKDTRTATIQDIFDFDISQNEIVFITASDSPYTVETTNKVISCDTTAGAITVKLPDSPDEGFRTKVVNYDGGMNVTVTTVSGTVNIGNTTSQIIRRDGGSIETLFQTSSTPDEYLIVQDSRNSPENRITVTKAADLEGTLDSTKEYFIDGQIDMGDTTITVPSGGLILNGYGFGVSKLFSTENSYTMFNGGGTNNGDLFISNMTFDVSGTSSKVFDIDNSSDGTKAFEMTTVNFENCTAVGEITGYRQGLFRNIGIFDSSDGFTFSGTWSGGVRVEAFIVRGFGSSGTIFKEGTSLTFGSRFFSNGNVLVPSGSVGYNFTESVFTNDGDYQLQGGNFIGGGTYTSGADETSIKSRWRNNNNLNDTYVGAEWVVSTEEATVIASPSTAVQAAGTTAASNEIWITQSANNTLTYLSSITSKVDFLFAGTFTSGNNNQIRIVVRHWDASAASYTDISETLITANGSGRAENATLIGTIDLDTEDRVEVWVENQSGTTNITMKDNSKLVLTERQS